MSAPKFSKADSEKGRTTSSNAGLTPARQTRREPSAPNATRETGPSIEDSTLIVRTPFALGSDGARSTVPTEALPSESTAARVVLASAIDWTGESRAKRERSVPGTEVAEGEDGIDQTWTKRSVGENETNASGASSSS